MYKTETILGLTGSIIAAVFTALSVAGTLLAIFFIDLIGPTAYSFIDRFLIIKNWVISDWSYGTFMNLASFVIIVCVGAGVVIAAASFILGFLGTAKLRRDDKGGGVLLIIAAALAFISVIGLIPFVLMLVGGIMAVSKKAPPAPPEESVKAV